MSNPTLLTTDTRTKLLFKNFDNLQFPDLCFFQPKKLFLIKDHTLEIRYLNFVSDEINQDLSAIKKHSFQTIQFSENDFKNLKQSLSKSVSTSIDGDPRYDEVFFRKQNSNNLIDFKKEEKTLIIGSFWNEDYKVIYNPIKKLLSENGIKKVIFAPINIAQKWSFPAHSGYCLPDILPIQ